MNFLTRVVQSLRAFFSTPAQLNENSRLWVTQMLDYLPKPFFLIDFETKQASYSNAAARRMMGMEYAENPAEHAYLKLFTLYDKEGKLVEAHNLPSARVLRGEKVNGDEYELITLAGKFTINVFSEDIPAMHGQKHLALIIFQDITALKQTEKSLLRVQADLNEAIEISQTGFWSVDTVTNDTTLSPYLLEQFGLTPETFDGTLECALQRIHSEDRERVRAAIQKSISEGSGYHIEYRVVHPSGDVRWIEAKSGSKKERAVDPHRFSGTTLDVTGRVRSMQILEMKERALEIALKTAETANAAKSQFLANMSHEIRTPLGAIMGFTDLLKEPNLETADRLEFVSVIERNSAQLMHIIEDILDLSKVEAGMMQIEEIDFSLPELLRDFSSLMEFKSREKGIQFAVETRSDIPAMVTTDPTRLRQILLNVVGNAVKFTDQGCVTLRIRYAHETLEFEVEDTGRGISPEQAQNLFKPFAQADASTTRHFGGTGLGLVLSRSLAEALGGSFILKTSELGRGSVFVARIKAPASSATRMSFGTAAPEVSTPVAVPPARLSGLRILLVEDSPDNQNLISIYLNKAGAKFDIASDGEKGVEMALSAEYHLVLMDVQMPIMDGITAVRKLRGQGYGRPIIALTAHAMKDEKDRCLNAGFNDFLSKPIDREEMLATIREYCPTNAPENSQFKIY